MLKIRTKKYYAYWLSDKNKSGISDNWKECEKIVSGKNARYKSFKSKKEAENWLKKGAEYVIRPVKKIERGIYFDSGTGRNQTVEVSVTNEEGDNFLNEAPLKVKINEFGKHPVSGVTNNYGELLACKYALQIATKQGIKKIFSDSRLVLDYWSRGFIKKKELPRRTVKLAEEVTELRKNFENSGGEMGFIEGDYNPADLGFHR